MFILFFSSKNLFMFNCSKWCICIWQNCKTLVARWIGVQVCTQSRVQVLELMLVLTNFRSKHTYEFSGKTCIHALWGIGCLRKISSVSRGHIRVCVRGWCEYGMCWLCASALCFLKKVCQSLISPLQLFLCYFHPLVRGSLKLSYARFHTVSSDVANMTL